MMRFLELNVRCEIRIHRPQSLNPILLLHHSKGRVLLYLLLILDEIDPITTSIITLRTRVTLCLLLILDDDPVQPPTTTQKERVKRLIKSWFLRLHHPERRSFYQDLYLSSRLASYAWIPSLCLRLHMSLRSQPQQVISCNLEWRLGRQEIVILDV